MSQIFFGLDTIIIFNPVGFRDPRVIWIAVPVMSQKTFCEVNKPFLSKHVSCLRFPPASVLLKSRMGAAIAPSWAMNILYFQMSNRCGGMMIKRLPRVTTHSPALFPKTLLPVGTELYCCVKDVLGWNFAPVVWENTKNNFLFLRCIGCSAFVYQTRNLEQIF